MSKHTQRGSEVNVSFDETVVTYERNVEQHGSDDPPLKAAYAAAELGKLGGAARARKLTPERRREIAQKAAARRWSNRKD